MVKRFFLLLSLVACGSSPAPASTTTPTAKTEAEPAKTNVVVTPEARAIVDAADRSADDKKLDAGRKPGEMLSFFGIKPGMKVAEIFAGGGYTTELLARSVGPSGVVYGQNTPLIVEKFAKAPWAARMDKPVNKNVVTVVREIDDPLPPEATNLDAVVSVLVYHDTVWMTPDRTKMNATIFKALKSGGVYGIIDHSARPGAGMTEVKTNHRIEEKSLIEEVVKAGFKLTASADFLRNPNDTRDWNDSPMAAGDKRGTSDRFALKFVKP